LLLLVFLKKISFKISKPGGESPCGVAKGFLENDKENFRICRFKENSNSAGVQQTIGPLN
jgi:hypothetical protein